MFRQEKKAGHSRSVADKLSVLSKIENQSKRAAEKTLEQESVIQFNTTFGFDSQNHVTDDVFGEALQMKLKRLREVVAHKHPEISLHKLIEKMADFGLEKWDPLEKAKRALSRQNELVLSKAPETNSNWNDASIPAPVRVNQRNNRYIQASIRHAVFARDKGKCQNCGSQRQIEIDHFVPFAKGGNSEVGNLRLLCRACNQRHAINAYGLRKIELFVHR